MQIDKNYNSHIHSCIPKQQTINNFSKIFWNLPKSVLMGLRMQKYIEYFEKSAITITDT